MDPVLKASVNDVRYFAALLRGVNFVNKATITVTEGGLTVIVEDARTLLGTAYIFSDIFDEYVYTPESVASSQRSNPDETQAEDEEMDNAAFEIPLNTLLECLNVFGTAGPSSSGSSGGPNYRRWRDNGDSDVGEGGDEQGRAKGRALDRFFGGSSDKRTAMRMSYSGAGHPLTLFLAEDANGPTATCEISTYEPEPLLELPFDGKHLILKIILKSSWLRDALSELDPSCTILTFIGNPQNESTDAAAAKTARSLSKPIFRIQAAGTFGSTEMDYPNDREVLESFSCQKPVKCSYHFAHVSKAARALQSSTKTSLRIDDQGLLSMQFLMPPPAARQRKGGDDKPAFIDFSCLALDDNAR